MKNIDAYKCVGCGLCVKVCPSGIEIVDGIATMKNGNADCLEKALNVCPQDAISNIDKDLYFALGTDDYKTIKPNDHFGMSNHFLIYQYSQGKLVFKENRDNVKYKEDEERVHGDPGKAKATSSVLENVDVIVGKMFGPNIIRLRDKYVCVVVREPEIKKAEELIKNNISRILEEYNKKERKGIILS